MHIWRFDKLIIGLLILCLTCFCAVSVNAMPLSPPVTERLRAEGKLDEYVNSMKDARARGVNQPGTVAAQLQRSKLVAGTGPDTLHVLVILVDFSDHPADGSSGVFGTPEMFDSLLFSHGLNPMGSMTEFYEENSWGQVTIIGDVAGWYRMPEPYAYYVDGQRGFGEYPRSAEKLAEDACVAADPDVDFTLYDLSGNGWVDGMFVVHSGPGYEDTGNENAIHSHVSHIVANLILDGVQIGIYSMEPEESAGGTLSPIGVYCHEYGHVLGLPDLYDYDYDTPGIGDWSLMAGGSWALSGRRPVHFDAWCKARLGWLELINITELTTGLSAPAIEYTPVAYRIWKNGEIGPEYFIISNRQKYSFDRSVPGKGLLIYHVDEAGGNNDNNWRRLVDVEQADGRFDLNWGIGDGDNTDPWYAPRATHFDDQSVPDSRAYSAEATQVAVCNISEIDSVMTFDAEVSFTRPYLIVQSLEYSDSVGGDGDGIPEPGETIEVYASMVNIWAAADDVELRMTVHDPVITVLDSVAYLGAAPPHVTIDNGTQPLRFTSDPNMGAKFVDFSFVITAGAGTFHRQHDYRWTIGHTQFLVVDADSLDEWSYHRHFTRMLDSMLVPYDVHDELVHGVPSPEQIGEYPCAIWFDGDHRATSITPEDVAVMKSFLDGGGKLLLTGQDLIEHIHELPDSAFLADYLHVAYGGTSPYPVMYGVPGDPITGELTIACNSSGGAANQKSLDILVPLPGAEPIFHYYGGDDVAGIRYEDIYQVVILGFGMEGIADLLPGYNKRVELMTKIWEWWKVAVPGDFNNDREVNAIDVVLLVNYLFHGDPLPSNASGDVNGSCRTDLGDAVYLVNYVFRLGPAPVPPCSE